MIDHYVVAATVHEAVGALAAYAGKARVIAGGTDLMIQLQAEQHPDVRVLVDVATIPEMREIRTEDAYVVVGSAVTFAEIRRSQLIRDQASVLHEAAGWVASPQIRNVGTLGGNVANAQPAADGSIALTALGAEAEVAGRLGRRWLPMHELFDSPGVSRVNSTAEVITAFRFVGHQPHEASAFERLARRKAVALPLINVGVWVRLDGDQVSDARVAIGPAAPVPFRACGAEEVLKGREATAEAIDDTANQAMAESNPRSSLLRAGRPYRKELVRVLTRRALERAVEKAGG